MFYHRSLSVYRRVGGDTLVRTVVTLPLPARSRVPLPPARTGVPPLPARSGVPPPPLPPARTGCAADGTPLVVSCRRTVLSFCMVKFITCYSAYFAHIMNFGTSRVISSLFLKGINYLREVLSVVDIRQHLIVF